MLIFQNPGLIDIRAAITMGVNVKSDDNAIGFFGTGLKYAIASILRWEGHISIFRGNEEFKFTAPSIDIRGKTFRVVQCNGRELGFVTDYGKTWEPWQVYRELYTNTMDEGGEIHESHVALSEESTTIIVDCASVETAHANRSAFIISDPAEFSIPTADVWFRPATGVFYQNLRVSNLMQSSIFTYNIKRKVELTEDRTLKHSFEFDRTVSMITDALCNSLDPAHQEHARRLMTANQDNAEGNVHFFLSGSGPRTEAFFKLAAKIARHNLVGLNYTIREELLKRKPTKETLQTFEPSFVQQQMLDRAIEFSNALGYDVNAYPIVCAEQLASGVHGLAHQGTIYLARETFDLGTKYVASTLIEEFIHLRYDVNDCTRELQTMLFNKIVTLGEELIWKAPL